MFVRYQPTATPATKSAIQKSLGGTLQLAIAMVETANLLSTYDFGDNKQDDAANFGIYKMNWGMIRQCPSAIAIGVDAAIVGPKINGDPALATQILLEAMQMWSINSPEPNHPVANNFWAGHRQGSTGLNNVDGADWADIQDYYLGVQVLKAKCDGDTEIWTSSVRYYVDIDPI
jgi:hypothetical protein